MTITNIIIKKNPCRKWDRGVNDVMPGSDGLRFLLILKNKLVEIWLWAGQSSWVDDYERCRNSQHSKNCISLSSCRKTKTQEVNKTFVPEQRESSVFQISPHLYFLHIFIWVLCYTKINLSLWIKEKRKSKRYNPTDFHSPIEIIVINIQQQ